MEIIMVLERSDKEWEKFGAKMPYYGVVTHKKYYKNELSDQEKEEFFNTGEEHIKHVMYVLKNKLGINCNSERALDFGCGVGRLTIPLAKISGHVTGIDVSEAMLEEAKVNSSVLNIKNISFFKSEDDLSNLTGNYDFIHSYIVLQHIRTSRGIKIIQRLLDLLEDGGIGVLHITYGKNIRRKLICLFKSYIPYAKNIANLIKGRKFNDPNVEMNSYDLNDVFGLLHNYKIANVYLELSDHGGEYGVLIYFAKNIDNAQG